MNVNGVIKRYQWMRNGEGGQKFGNCMEIRPLTEEAFIKYVAPRLILSFASTLAEYCLKCPGLTHYAVVLRDGDSEWQFTGVSSLEELEAEPKRSIWAIKVENFDSPEAIAHGKQADSGL